VKRLLTGLVVFCLSSGLSRGEGPWRVTRTVDSLWALAIQVTWNSATAQSFHANFDTAAQNTWPGVMQNVIYTPIAAPSGGWKAGPTVENRFDATAHVVFGRAPISGDRLDPRRHGVFLVDTYTGATYVMTKNQNTVYTDPNFPFNNEFTLSYWTYIQEASDLPSPPTSDVGRYEISSVGNSAYAYAWPYLTRLDRVTGRVDVAIPTHLVNSGATFISYFWYRIAD
jgi:hypothetical protein